MASFGKKGQQGGGAAGAACAPAGKPVRAAQPSPHVIYREGETERPGFHGSFVELHWPKFGAAAFALLALAVSASSGKTNITSLILMTLLAGGISYFVLNKVRKSINDVHTARTEIFRSPRFATGAALGFGYFLYSTFTGEPNPADNEMAQAVAEFTDPLGPFRDGFQQKDFSAVAMLILKAAGMMVLGGIIVKAIARRLLGEEEAGSVKNAG